jgi:hypothetical protein
MNIERPELWMKMCRDGDGERRFLEIPRSRDTANGGFIV